MIDQLRQSDVACQLIPLEGMVAVAASDWRDRAECRDMDPDLFFAEDFGQDVPVEVIVACGLCPVSDECLADAAKSAAWYDGGVRGGLSQEQRRGMSRPREQVPA